MPPRQRRVQEYTDSDIGVERSNKVYSSVSRISKPIDSDGEDYHSILSQLVFIAVVVAYAYLCQDPGPSETNTIVSLYNAFYPPIDGINKLYVERNTVWTQSLLGNSIIIGCAWPLLMLKRLPFIRKLSSLFFFRLIPGLGYVLTHSFFRRSLRRLSHRSLLPFDILTISHYFVSYQITRLSPSSIGIALSPLVLRFWIEQQPYRACLLMIAISCFFSSEVGCLFLVVVCYEVMHKRLTLKRVISLLPFAVIFFGFQLTIMMITTKSWSLRVFDLMIPTTTVQHHFSPFYYMIFVIPRVFYSLSPLLLLGIIRNQEYLLFSSIMYPILLGLASEKHTSLLLYIMPLLNYATASSIEFVDKKWKRWRRAYLVLVSNLYLVFLILSLSSLRVSSYKYVAPMAVRQIEQLGQNPNTVYVDPIALKDGLSPFHLLDSDLKYEFSLPTDKELHAKNEFYLLLKNADTMPAEYFVKVGSVDGEVLETWRWRRLLKLQFPAKLVPGNTWYIWKKMNKP